MKNLATAIFLAISTYTVAGRKLQAVDELVWGDVAPTLTSGECTDGCTECRNSWYSSDNEVHNPTNEVFRCKDNTVMKYRNKCNSLRLITEGKTNLCMSTGKCHWSFPANENKNSENATCRTLPESYNNLVGDQEWEYGRKPQSLKRKGLCQQSCEGEVDDFWTTG